MKAYTPYRPNEIPQKSSVLTQKLLANKIDAYVGFNLLKPAHRNDMIAKRGSWLHAVRCTDGKEVGRIIFSNLSHYQSQRTD
jgi:hypothetical protein